MWPFARFTNPSVQQVAFGATSNGNCCHSHLLNWFLKEHELAVWCMFASPFSNAVATLLVTKNKKVTPPLVSVTNKRMKNISFTHSIRWDDSATCTSFMNLADSCCVAGKSSVVYQHSKLHHEWALILAVNHSYCTLFWGEILTIKYHHHSMSEVSITGT